MNRRDHSEQFEIREFFVSNCWQIIRSNLFKEKVELDSFSSSVATLAGFVFIGVLYTRRGRGNREIIPARFFYLQPVLRKGEKYARICFHAFPSFKQPNLSDPIFHSWRREGQLVTQMRRNVRIGCMCEVTQTNGQSGYLAVSLRPSAGVCNLQTRILKIRAQKSDDRNVGKHFPCRAGSTPSR